MTPPQSYPNQTVRCSLSGSNVFSELVGSKLLKQQVNCEKNINSDLENWNHCKWRLVVSEQMARSAGYYQQWKWERWSSDEEEEEDGNGRPLHGLSEWPVACPLCGRKFQARGDIPKHLLTGMHMDQDLPAVGSVEWLRLVYWDRPDLVKKKTGQNP